MRQFIRIILYGLSTAFIKRRASTQSQKKSHLKQEMAFNENSY